MPVPVRIGLIGNSFASRAQLPALRHVGGNIVIGLAGANGQKARDTARAWGIPKSSDDWRDVVALDCDLLILTTPVDLHAPMVRAALETRAAILCEKPFALDADEARELAHAASGRLALVDHQLRWSPWRLRMRELVREGFLGEPWSARCEMHFGSKARLEAPYSWWYDAARGGGMLGAIGSHMLDALQFDLGPVDALRARLCTYRTEREDADGVARTVTADEHASLWLALASGAQATVEANIMAPGGRRSLIEYVGSRGTLRLEDEETLLAAPHGEPLARIEVAAEVPGERELGIRDPGIFERTLPLYLRDVLQAVRDGAPALEHAATFADAVETMRVIDAARRSAAGATWVPCGT